MADIDGIVIRFPVCYIGNFLSAVIQTCIGEGYRGRSAPYGDTAVIHHRVACGKAVEHRVIGHLDFQITALILYRLDIFRRRRTVSCIPAYNIQLISQILMDNRTVITGKV